MKLNENKSTAIKQKFRSQENIKRMELASRVATRKRKMWEPTLSSSIWNKNENEQSKEYKIHEHDNQTLWKKNEETRNCKLQMNTAWKK